MRIRVTETKGTQAQRQAIYSACGELAIRRARKLGLPVTFVRGTDIVKEFADGTEEGIDRIAYPGTERNKAIKEFNDIKKRLPNQEYILDIEKGPWE